MAASALLPPSKPTRHTALRLDFALLLLLLPRMQGPSSLSPEALLCASPAGARSDSNSLFRGSSAADSAEAEEEEEEAEEARAVCWRVTIPAGSALGARPECEKAERLTVANWLPLSRETDRSLGQLLKAKSSIVTRLAGSVMLASMECEKAERPIVVSWLPLSKETDRRLLHERKAPSDTIAQAAGMDTPPLTSGVMAQPADVWGRHASPIRASTCRRVAICLVKRPLDLSLRLHN
jgi:hypothetical protein